MFSTTREKMKLTNPFFRLDGAEITTVADFYELLDGSDRIEDRIFRPDELNPRQDGQRTKINGKTFSKVSFTRTVIRDIEFRDCHFVDCLFIAATLDKCEFHQCVFKSVNTHKIQIVGTYIDPGYFKQALDKKLHQNIGVHLYQTLMNNSHDEEQPEFKERARFEFLRWKRLQESYEVAEAYREGRGLVFGKRVRIARRWIWQVFFGSGVRLRHFMATAAGFVILVTLVNYVFSSHFGIEKSDKPLMDLSEAFYFTTITVSTVGYGDFTPTTPIGRIVVAFEGIAGLFLFALLASMLFRKISP